MGFFNDLKADIAQAVDELTDTEGENVKKESRKSFGKKAKKPTPVKISSGNDSEEDLFKGVEGEEERTEAENEIWNQIRSDLAEGEAAGNTDDAGEEDDGVEELEEIEENYESHESKFHFGEVPVSSTNHKTDFLHKNTKPVNYTLPEGELSDEVGVITAGMTVIGNIYTPGHLEVYGNVEGDVEVRGSLRLLGTVSGNIKAGEVIVETGKIKGDVECTGGFSIANGAVIIGSVRGGTGAMIGGAVKGDIDIHGPVTLDSTAIVKGNIKSASVQMTTGAMVDGMCSQCYSDVDLSSFFENM
ncbi:MAG: polymer-forming cytoskeletal protein [Lachnospiraceae bacterium]|nr:polymer-forming cytoskeletal protein [Lachnospiraceae bacterium]